MEPPKADGAMVIEELADEAYSWPLAAPTDGELSSGTAAPTPAPSMTRQFTATRIPRLSPENSPGKIKLQTAGKTVTTSILLAQAK